VNSSLYRVAVRIPPVWTDRTALWLAQFEAQFELAVVTSQKTKFNQVVSQLQQQHAAEVQDIITTPP
jgi:putative lipoic acid-binding regulatory protein